MAGEAAIAADECGGVSLRSELNIFRKRNHRTAAVVRLGELLDEGVGSAGNERKLNVVPIFTDSVVYNRPTLKKRFLVGFGRKNDAIGGFPDGDFADVADIEIAFAGAGGRNGHTADVLLACGSDEAKIAADFELKIVIEDADGR